MLRDEKIVSGISGNVRESPTLIATEEKMNVTELKHQVKLKDWQERIMECRSQGISVAQWWNRC